MQDDIDKTKVQIYDAKGTFMYYSSCIFGVPQVAGRVGGPILIKDMDFECPVAEIVVFQKRTRVTDGSREFVFDRGTPLPIESATFQHFKLVDKDSNVSFVQLSKEHRDFLVRNAFYLEDADGLSLLADYGVIMNVGLSMFRIKDAGLLEIRK